MPKGIPKIGYRVYRVQAELPALLMPKSRCGESPTRAHHYIQISSKEIYVCKYCNQPKWFPLTTEDARDYQQKVYNDGLDTAYLNAVQKRPRLYRRLRQLQRRMKDGN